MPTHDIIVIGTSAGGLKALGAIIGLLPVEMPQGREPTFGRAGAKTMVLLNETELCAA